MLAASKCTAESLWIHILEITLTLKIFLYVDCSAIASRLPFSLPFLSLKFLQCNYAVTVDETHLSQVPFTPKVFSFLTFLSLLSQCYLLSCSVPLCCSSWPHTNSEENWKNGNRVVNFQSCVLHLIKMLLLGFPSLPTLMWGYWYHPHVHWQGTASGVWVPDGDCAPVHNQAPPLGTASAAITKGFCASEWGPSGHSANVKWE